LLEAAVGGRYNLYIHSLFAGRSNASYGPLIEEAQQFGLQSKGHIANLIQKQSALVCLEDQSASSASPAPSEGSVTISEEFSLD